IVVKARFQIKILAAQAKRRGIAIAKWTAQRSQRVQLKGSRERGGFIQRGGYRSPAIGHKVLNLPCNGAGKRKKSARLKQVSRISVRPLLAVQCESVPAKSRGAAVH